MNRLLREIAPLTERAWDEIETEARRTLKTGLAARRVVDFTGPKGWEQSAVDSARAAPSVVELSDGLTARVRRVQPMLELRRPFEVPRATLDALDRGSRDADLDMVIDAAQAIARAEDRIVFHGYDAAQIVGICTGAADAALPIGADYADYPALVASALASLRENGVDGPYAIALGKRCYTGLAETTKEGYPVLQHVQRLIEGPLVWAPAVDGAVVLSMRGDDFELIVGEDLSVGYLSHDREQVTLYLEESLTFRLLSPQAAVPLVYHSERQQPLQRKSRARGRAPR
jgi:uncharacterized linocin/CFP29 family protein